ncbi:hypothetical protein A0J61_03670 [Choanephora cucurbitarum]|uniref:Uncharacterized protein n=1 Tax=Choanephora cucurbitarum TaxID=101091 RepID=A0A1C7NIB8_9FUNG|nr:hypothetical protein A0J61_03670 [Choanephora cucurbitarum]
MLCKKSLEEGFLLSPSHTTLSIARKLTIGGGFSNYKADEWATWFMVLSPCLLVDKLNTSNYNHWLKIV